MGDCRPEGWIAGSGAAAEEVTAGGWLIRRWLPALLLVGSAGAGLAWLRASLFFLPGIQGMAAGGATGWLAGRLGRRDPVRLWTFGQRIWLGLGMALAFGAVHLGTLSATLAGPIDPPLRWLLEVVDGSGREPFLGLARHTTHAGFLEGGWWIGLNLLDLLLFAFLFLVGTGVGHFPDRPGEAEGDEGEEPVCQAEPRGSRSARFACLGLGVLLAGGGFAYHHAYVRREAMDFSMAGLDELRGLAGKWQLDDGGGLFGPQGKGCGVAVEAGFGILSLKPDDGLPGERGDTWRLNLTRSRARDFSGLVFFHGPGHEGRMPVPVRARFSPDGGRITLAWSAFSPAGRRDVVARGVRPTNRK